MANLSIEQEYPMSDTTDTLTGKDWAGGSNVPETVKELIIPLQPNDNMADNVVTLTYAPRFTKLFDELIVNALDHILRCLDTSNPVTQISATFNRNDGSLSVYNDGKGIPVAIHKAATESYGRDMYVVEFIMGIIFQGSNRNRSADCIIGGTNGIGAKLTNAHSLKFTVETTDTERKLHYTQTWRDHIRVCERPIIKPATARNKGTTITYWPDYELLGCAHPSKDDSVADMIDMLIRTRAITAAVYAGFAVTMNRRPGTTIARIKKPVVSYNAQKLTMFTKTSDIANVLFPNMPMITMRVCPTEELTPTGKVKPQCAVYNMDWEMTVVAVPKIKKEHSTLTVINGIVAKDGGHIKRAQAIVADAICGKLKGRINDTDIEKVKKRIGDRVFIVLYCQIPNPGWEGQRKDRLSFKKDKFSHYIIEKKAANDLGSMMADNIAEEFVQGTTSTKSNTKKLIIPLSTYRPALAAGNPRVKGKCLIVTEGKSAMTSATQMGLPAEKYGYLALGGVIVNARRETTVSGNDDDTHQYVVQKDTFKNNLMINYIIEVTGLDVKNKQYASTAKLQYDAGILMLTDQDTDGKGNILALFMSMVAHLWPGLYSQGYIRWLETPIIRAFPKARKGKVIEQFYSLEKYEDWAQKIGAKINSYNVYYYKGLARHKREDWQNIAKTLDQHTYTYVYKAEHAEWFDVYFGKDANKRKAVLCHPPITLSAAQTRRIEQTRKINCDEHLRTETHAFQRDNIERKLVCNCDGAHQSGRKIIDGVLWHLPAGEVPRVANFAGLIVNKENYHHGEASLEQSLFRRMQIYVGGVQLPFIVPAGNAGMRAAGGDDHGAPRYVNLTSNKRLIDLLFPKVDYNMLEFQFSEGERCEPKYFVPIVPLAICESMGMPGHGWKIELWARDLTAVVNNVRQRIINDDIEGYRGDLYELPPYTYHNTKIKYIGECIGDVTYGAFEYECDANGNENDNVIIITELPLRKWTANYLAELQKRMVASPEDILDIADITPDPNQVKIRVVLAPGVIARFAADKNINSVKAATIEYLRLRTNMNSHINMMTTSGEVVEYKRYIDVVNDWYPYRKDLYIRRCERLSIIQSLQIGMYENIVRYVRESNTLGLAKCSVAKMIEKLENEGYTRYHRAMVNDPGFTPTANIIEAATLSSNANYDYLIDLSDRQKSAESLEKYENKLAALREESEHHEKKSMYGAFRGAHLWLDELDALMEVYTEGCATDWTFGEQADMTYAN